jgi:hypothetical protein
MLTLEMPRSHSLCNLGPIAYGIPHRINCLEYLNVYGLYSTSAQRSLVLVLGDLGLTE